ncbi:MAG: hypothetical protein CMK92_06115 [Pseudomonas sp.]|nr:hypothetical protein [Pseudomonas sp.]
MKQEHYEIFKENLEFFFCGNTSAIDFAMHFIKMVDVWDDIIDKDSPTNDDINRAFIIALTDFDENVFYASFREELKPIILSIILRWLDANKLEEKKEHLEKAYMLRAGLYDLFAHIAYLIGGFDWYGQIGEQIRKLYGENYKDYEEEICQIQ